MKARHPWRSIIARQIAKPNPIPVGFRRDECPNTFFANSVQIVANVVHGTGLSAASCAVIHAASSMLRPSVLNNDRKVGLIEENSHGFQYAPGSARMPVAIKPPHFKQ
jgi:hypothetical protein